ncbi:melanoregulin isoform X2 [Xenopus tropicalis]|uniref:Melanoregulin n=1 Tax=Xenopus tropicalis TaxID=8364 RepID=A0A5S6P3B6_XENTR|nr:melanoregulin isoform X2 [Xenopus tropicalis]|eukprot:XP_012825877.1 PREDICTED: melanoregulin isoform X2 [Xenopus tropicalis]
MQFKCKSLEYMPIERGHQALSESMCLKDWLCAFCCLRLGCLEYPKNEKQPLVSGNNNQYKTYAVIDDDERNLWSSPHDLSHTEAVDDRMLQSWIQTRNQLEKDSEEWQKLNYEIYTLRQARREVRARWRRILEDLGFQKEAETLLSVTKQSTISNPKNMKRAMELLVKLSDNTTIFPAGWDLPVRYLYIMDRLICLDAVDDFLNIAQKKYPKTKMDISQ